VNPASALSAESSCPPEAIANVGMSVSTGLPPASHRQHAAMPRPPLSAAQREDLSDARLMIDTASHNLRLSTTAVVDVANLATALANAETQLDQALITLRRLRAVVARHRP